MKRPVRFAADGIQQRDTPAFPVVAFENVYFLIGSVSLVD